MSDQVGPPTQEEERQVQEQLRLIGGSIGEMCIHVRELHDRLFPVSTPSQSAETKDGSVPEAELVPIAYQIKTLRTQVDEIDEMILSALSRLEV